MTGSTRRSGEAGYNMVLLIMAVTVLNIMIAAALPYWSTIMQREKEEELIFRGLQYAEGIRLFQRRFGRLPVQLQELLEVEPRCMRQLFEDPMTDSGEWGLLFATAAPQRPGQPGQPGRPGQPGQPEQPGAPGTGPQAVPDDGTNPSDPQDVGGGDGTVGFGGDDEDGRQVTVGPIQGVFSRSEDESLLVWNGETQYNRWHFTVNLLTGGSSQFANLPIGVPNQGRQISSPSVRWLGRPLPDFIPPGGLPGASGAGGGGNAGEQAPGRRNLPNTLGGGQRQPGGAQPGGANRPN